MENIQFNNFFITGDRHGNFKDIYDFCKKYQTTKQDLIIILGDSGINYLGANDCYLKQKLALLPITLFCIQGNHDLRPIHVNTYKEIIFFNGIVYQEEKYPNLLFAKDGEVFNFPFGKTLVIGGAYSVDKEYRLAFNKRWFPDEQPSEEIKIKTELAINMNKDIKYIFSHTCPISKQPVDSFLSGIDQSKIDNSTEKWLEIILYKIQENDFNWYCGHYHINREIDNFHFLYDRINSL